MIYEIDIANAWRFGNGLEESHRLRHALYVQGSGWDVPTVDGMEYDEFDNLATRYLLGRDQVGKVRATQRCIFCNRPYMMQSLWPELVEGGRELPADATWVEGTRAGVDQRLPKDEQLKWRNELLIANVEWSLHHGIRYSSFVTYKAIVDKFMIPVGYPVELWGPPKDFPDGTYVAGYYAITEALLSDMRERVQIHDKVFVPLTETIALDEARAVRA